MDNLEHSLLSAESFYLATSECNCWVCKKPTRVYAVYANHVMDHSEGFELEEPVSFSDMSKLNPELAQVITHVTEDRLRMDFYSNSDREYYMNHCEHCGAKIGDFYLFHPDGGFYPWSEEDFQKISFLHYELPLKVDGGYNIGIASSIFEAKGILT